MCLNNNLQCLGKLSKGQRFGIIFFMAIGMISCNVGAPEKQRERPMIYEGMPTTELTQLLGEPDSIQSGGMVYNANFDKNLVVKKWYYNTRTIVVIDDTVKTPQLMER